MAKRKKSNYVGITKRRQLLKICQHLQISNAAQFGNRAIVATIAKRCDISLVDAHKANVAAVLSWFHERHPQVFQKPLARKPKPHAKSYQKQGRREAFYKSWEWRTLRMQVLKEHGARCQCCGAGPQDTAMSGEPVRICVDHVKPLATHWALRLERSNLQVLCDECNQGKGAWDETDWRVDEAIEAQLRYQV